MLPERRSSTVMAFINHRKWPIDFSGRRTLN
jgi:hypothetical protein